MNALIIILGVLLGIVLLLLLAVLFGRAKIRIICQGKIKVMASVLGIRFTVYSDQKKKKKKRLLHRCDDPDKVLKRELRRQKKALEKKRKKRKKAKTKKEKRIKRGHPDPNLIENLQMIQTLLKKLYAVTKGALRIKVRRMHISIGTEDAAKTAITYGVAVQSAAYLLEFIDTHFTKIRRKNGAMAIVPDYLSETTTSDIDISCSIGLRRAVSIALTMYSSYKAERKLALAKARRRYQEEKKAEKTNKK